MQKSKETKMAVTTTLATMILLFAATMTIAPFQQAYSLSRYIVGADNPNEKIYQPLEKDPIDKGKPLPIPTTTSNSSIVPIAGCAMDPIESLESFLSCLGAK
jgi:hypothetical protein